MPRATSVFVDSNVLVYALDTSEPAKRTTAQDWLDRLWAAQRGRLSVQVINESYWNATRKLPSPVNRQEAQAVLRRYVAWLVPDLGEQGVTLAWKLETAFQLAFWDALIVAFAQHAGCRVLLSEDLQDGRCLVDLVVVDPFQHTPDEVLGGDGLGRVSDVPPRARRRRSPRRA